MDNSSTLTHHCEAIFRGEYWVILLFEKGSIFQLLISNESFLRCWIVEYPLVTLNVGGEWAHYTVASWLCYFKILHEYHHDCWTDVSYMIKAVKFLIMRIFYSYYIWKNNMKICTVFSIDFSITYVGPSVPTLSYTPFSPSPPHTHTLSTKHTKH